MTMQSPSQPDPPRVNRVPDELLQQLHEANARFHRAKEQLEGAMNNTDFAHQHHLNQAESEMREAERVVEEIDRRIRAELQNE